MLRKCTSKEDVKKAVDYIGDDYMTTPYLYVDIIQYGMGTPHVTTWIDDDNGIIQGLYLLYFDCLHFYTKNFKECDLKTLMELKDKHDPKVIMVQGKVGEYLETFLKDGYFLERNYVYDMSAVGRERTDYKGEIADRNDIEQIVDLLLTDELYSNVFSKEILLTQMLERFDDGFSRYIVIKDGSKVVSTCSTYGEVEGLAIIGNLMVHPDYRHRGLGVEVEGYFGRMVSKEGKVGIACVNYNNTPSINLNERMGCKRVGALYKFVRF